MNIQEELLQKANVWTDTRDTTKGTPTEQQVADEMEMRESYHRDQEWVGIHIRNMITLNSYMAIEEVEYHIALRLNDRPDLQPAYDLFMKPFRAQE